MAGNQSYIYSIEFTIEDFEFFNFPVELECPDDLDFLVRFQMKPDIVLEVMEDEHIDSLNCNEKAMKKIMFPMSSDQLNCDPKACITAYKIQCPNDLIPCGCYNIHKIHCKFQELKKKFDCQNKYGSNCTPTSDIIKELVTLTNCDKNIIGSIHYTLCLTCCGPHVIDFNAGCLNSEIDDFGRLKSCTDKTEKAINECMSMSQNDANSDFDEYVAQINGNSLIVRVAKGQYVTQVFDESCDDGKDNLRIRGCDQQIDFRFPKNFTCCQCKKKYGDCRCKGDSDLTDYQHRTSCLGSSYKNSQNLPVIRGNLKYPGRFEDQTIDFDVQDHCRPTEATEKYKVRVPTSRAVCMQVENDRATSGLPKVPHGIEVCKIGCQDEVDVFVWKIRQRRTSKNGKKSGVELEMRTPRGPKIDIPKMETREVQVIEEEFEELKKSMKKEENETKTAVVANKNARATNAKSSVDTTKSKLSSSKKPPAAKAEVPPKRNFGCKK